MTQNALQVHTESILAPIRGDMVDVADGDQRIVARIAATLSIALRENPDLIDERRCSRNSLQNAILKCAADGLIPDSKEAVIIPYKGVANYQPMVGGIIKRMKELGAVWKIVVQTVHKNDEFDFDLSRQEILKHRFDIFAEDRGEIVGAYCRFIDDQDRTMHLEMVNRDDIDAARRASKAPDSPAWKNWFGEMAKKFVLRRGSKYITIDNSKLRDMIERLDEMFPYQNGRAEPQRMDPFTGKQIEGNAAAALPPAAGANGGEAAAVGQPPQGEADSMGSASPTDQDGQEEPEKPKLTYEVLQKFSDWLWNSKPTPADLKVDCDQFKAEHTAGRSATQELRDAFIKVQRIHFDRVEERMSEESVVMELAKLGVESPN